MQAKYAIWILAIGILLTGCGAESNVKKGDAYFALGEYFDAAEQYRTAYTKTAANDRSSRGIQSLKMADCYRLINYTQRAIGAYRNAIRYKRGDLNTHLHLAQMLLKDGQYKEAAAEYQTVIDSDATNQLARTGWNSATTALKQKGLPQRYIVKRMALLNSRRAEYSPMLCGDDCSQLYFTSTRNQAQGTELSGITGSKPGDIFMIQKDEKGKWGKVETISSGLNTEYDEGACCFSPDYKTMYLTQCKTDPTFPRYATICTSARSDAAWGQPKLLEISKDTLSSFAHPAISPDGEWLYFCSDMAGGLGGTDIWRLRLGEHGLGGAENLGAPINTPGNEEFPTFRPNGDLYFSSDGHTGLGGLDIYIARGDSTGHWNISHPDYPLNSKGDDFGMTFEGLHNRGYFSSNRGDARGWDHIYTFECPEILQTVKGWVYEQDGYELVNGVVHIVGNDGTNLRLNVKGDGSFTQEVKPGVQYVILGTCKGYLNHKEELTVAPSKESKEYVLQFPLASINVPVLINNIFYDFNKATLRPESTAALDTLVTLLNENQNITIELSAHCDYRGSEAYNEKLSQLRAENVVKYLVAHGIANDRLTPKGYGKSKPKVIKRKLTERYNWLKEGDVLNDEYIKKLPADKQEICNQLNRRTEFKVLRTTYNMFDKNGHLKNPPQKSTDKEKEDTQDANFNPFGDAQ
jgi:outer membrane protein OmpA-like peptidoglycan-associated protein